MYEMVVDLYVTDSFPGKQRFYYFMNFTSIKYLCAAGVQYALHTQGV